MHGLEGNRISRVSCGSSHSVCWTTPEAPITSCHEPVLFTAAKDPLGAGFVSGTSNNCGRGIEPGIQHNTFDHLADSRQSSSSMTGIASASGFGMECLKSEFKLLDVVNPCLWLSAPYYSGSYWSILLNLVFTWK